MANKRVKLVHGFLVVSEDFIVVKESATEHSDFAGVLAERNGDIPHYIILSDKPIPEMTASEENAIYHLCGNVYPEIAALLEKEVNAAVRNGVITNKEEWQNSPRLGLFAIPEVEDEEHLWLHTGIVREG